MYNSFITPKRTCTPLAVTPQFSHLSPFLPSPLFLPLSLPPLPLCPAFSLQKPEVRSPGPALCLRKSSRNMASSIFLPPSPAGSFNRDHKKLLGLLAPCLYARQGEGVFLPGEEYPPTGNLPACLWACDNPNAEDAGGSSIFRWLYCQPNKIWVV